MPLTPAPPPPPTPRPSLCCHRHRNLPHTGFCPCCLRERLTALEYSSSSRLLAAAVFDSVDGMLPASLISKPTEQASVERRRRSDSVSASKDEGLGLVSEPKRKSCDVRVRGNLIENNSAGEEFGLGYMERMINEIVEDEVVRKDCADVDAPRKKSLGRGFLAAASGFRKKWYNWRLKAKNTKQIDGKKLATLPVDEEISRQYRETQSEVADYGFGRRSCDAKPRFSLDAGRISLDDPRYSFEEARVSWDEHLITSFARMPAMGSVVEDARNVEVPVVGSKIRSMDEDVSMPGGLVQTKQYYLNSSSRRRKSFDRCNQIRKTAASVVAEIDELNMASNSNFNSLKDDSFDQTPVMGNEDRKEAGKSRRWNWKVWGSRHENGNVKNKSTSVNGCTSGSINRQNGSGNRFGGLEMNGNGRNESVLEKNWSLRYPSNHNGLLRFYLTPIRSSRRREQGKIKIKPNNSRVF